MTSYDHDENFGLYLAVLKKDEPTPLLPESDEDKGIGTAPPAVGQNAGRGGRGAAAATDPTQPDQTVPPAPRNNVRVDIDFDGIQQRIVAVPAVPERQYTQLRPGVPGTVFYMESSGRAAIDPATGAPTGGNVLHRYRLTDRRAAPFVTGVVN